MLSPLSTEHTCSYRMTTTWSGHPRKKQLLTRCHTKYFLFAPLPISSDAKLLSLLRDLPSSTSIVVVFRIPRAAVPRSPGRFLIAKPPSPVP